MSKLADKIRRVSSVQTQGLGFGAARAATEATMVLAGVARDTSSAADLLRRGADVAIIGSPRNPASPRKDGIEGIAGAWLAGKDGDAKAFREAGFDFVVFEPDATPATALLDENAGYVISLPHDLTDNEVRTLESFQLDAIYVGAIEGSLTVRKQIELRRIYAMTRKPLMAAVDAGIAVAELQALRDTNVLVVTAEGGGDVERLRRTIDALPPRTRRKDSEDRPTPLVPHSAVVDNGDDDD